MRAVAFNGSPRKGGNTEILLRTVLEELNRAGIETEFVQVGGRQIRGCTACYKCKERMNRRCSIENDIVNECISKMMSSDAIIIGSPTYFTDVTAETKALIDRAGVVSRTNGFALRRKIGAAVVAARRAGSIHAVTSINNFFLANQAIVPGSSYWNLGVGKDPGDVETDAEGMQTMKDLGANIAWLLKRITADS